MELSAFRICSSRNRQAHKISHYIFDVGDFDKRYATPARDIDYVEGAGGKLSADESYVVSALRDAERLAGVS